MLKEYLLRGGAPLALTSSMEDYLETVHILQKKYGNVRNIDISLHLGVTKPSVSRAVKELSKMGYLIKQADGTLSLTETGLTIASQVYEKHQFFTQQLLNILRVDLGTDAFVLTFWELVAKLIQHIFQMLLQGFIPEMLLNGIFPSPVDPQHDFFLPCHLNHQPFQKRQVTPTQREAPPAAAASPVLPDGGDGQRAPRGWRDIPAPAPAPRIRRDI